ncbi:3-hydroxyanthranilate 3 like protein [Argiope bruennichi]|uniref:3-hydroxyanthranilate 3 like protein n=1 Tax=Argiope bruennichi TaxID=94029 RepID=A0A8T0FRW6_ARGBR|nr:3-hydroxyanthranilate 3 like protein [Argiope bruennichi]
MDPIQYDINKWLEENKKFFVPPICNKLMYKDGQLKAFFVGGPNSRKDFHMEEGEEDVLLDKIFINEIPHSPQRIADTIGLVIERERAPNETDLLRYYIDGTDEILYEKWFRCENLEELGPLIKEYFNSEAYKTGKPIAGSLLEDKPIKQDFKRNLGGGPFFFGKKIMCLEKRGKFFPDNDFPKLFLWQIEGKSRITVDEKPYDFLKNQTMLIQSGSRYSILNDAGSRTLSVVMNPV